MSTLVAQPAQAQKFKVMHTFHGPNGALPWTQLTRDPAGNLYRTTSEGGKGICSNYGCGTASKLNKTGHPVCLHSFNGNNGRGPMAGLLRDAAGNFYGTTLDGGDMTCFSQGCGTVFKLDKGGRESVLYKFTGTLDGWFPEALLVRDMAGNGTTSNGGASNNAGTVFKVDTGGNETVLHSFCSLSNCTGGDSPYAGVIQDAAGNLYGVTFHGGDSGAGVVFELDGAGSETALYNFTGGSDGGGPVSVLVADAAGNLYGTTKGGGNLACARARTDVWATG